MSVAAGIAIIGMGCRFADADDLNAYWEMIREGRNGFGPVPPDRWPEAAFYDESSRAFDKSYAPHGAFIQDVRSFPAVSLQIPPRRVEVMDPQQRLALEISLQALDNAGLTPDSAPHRTGVYMGATAVEYRTLLSTRIAAQLMASGALGQAPADPTELARAVERVVPARAFTAAGLLSNMIAATVAQELRLHGPAFTSDAACASSLVSIAEAVAALRTDQVDCALAGGVYICVTPEHHIAFSRIGAMSRSGVCRPFDSRGDGFVQGDGCGVLVLKRLADAERDGDRIWAVIDGIAMNNDGGGHGPMAPAKSGQVEVIQAAWKAAGRHPSELTYLEAHGTATKVGDAIEFQGLNEVFGGQAEAVTLGSSKSNVGHTMSAAGVAGVLRAALALQYETLPPMANYAAPKPDLAIDDTPFELPTEARSWGARARVAAVSSFGFGGTNVHAVLSGSPSPKTEDGQAEVVFLSAPNEATLRTLAGRVADAIEAAPHATVADVAHSLAGRDAQPARLGLVAETIEELTLELRRVGEGDYPSQGALAIAPEEAPTVAFLYPGQGAQRIGMLADARERFPVIAQTLAEADAALPAPITALLYPTTDTDPVTAQARLTDTRYCQPALHAVGIALTHLLEQVGVTPDLVAGHSVGEFTAAAVGGVIDPHDALRYVSARGAAMSALEGDPGAMIALVAPVSQVSELLVDGAVIANINHPQQTVVSGTSKAVAQVGQRAEQAGLRTVPLDVSHGFHSPVFESLDLAALVSPLTLHDPQRPVASCISGRLYESADDARAVFSRHAVSPVDFTQAVDRCREAGATLYLQVAAGGPLRSFVSGSLKAAGESAELLSLAGMKDDDRGIAILKTLAELWVRGVPVNPEPIRAAGNRLIVPARVLPREHYWAVKNEAAAKIALSTATATVTQPTVEDTNTPESSPASSKDGIADDVLQAVARASAYPLAALRPEMTLGAELGFDSMMIAELSTELAKVIPGLPGLPQELLINDPSIAEVIAWAGSPHTHLQTNDNAPLALFQPNWVLCPAPVDVGLWDAHAPAAVRIVGPAADALRPALAAGGIRVAESAPALVYALGSEPHPTGDLVHELLAALPSEPVDLYLVRARESATTEGLVGFVRALAREWPEQRIQTITGAYPQELVAELHGSDRSVDVLYRGGQRHVAGFSPVSERSADLEHPGDQTVLITGGKGFIGRALSAALREAGATVLTLGRSAGDLRADVLDPNALQEALATQRITLLIHAAGVLADGPVGSTDGTLARRIKTEGLLNAVTACGESLQHVVALGSWAGRLGSRFQTHYAAANAQMSALVASALPASVRGVCVELPPWSDSDMVATIPDALQAAMRKEGVDFASQEAGLEVILSALRCGQGSLIAARHLPQVLLRREYTATLSAESHPYLADHAIENTPILPMAGAAALMVEAAGLQPPYSIRDLTLYNGVPVPSDVSLTLEVDGDRLALQAEQRRAYEARIAPAAGVSATLRRGDAVSVDIEAFYAEGTFHGPLLQGIVSIDEAAEGLVIGRIRTGRPSDWIPSSTLTRWRLDPLALDSAMQLSAWVAWKQLGRAGTPVRIERYTQLAPLPPVVRAQVEYDPGEGDRFEATITLWDGDSLVMRADGVVAELRKTETADTTNTEEINYPAEDVSQWPEYQALKERQEMLAQAGVSNPYFDLHQGTARDTSLIGERKVINFSSYNYLGLSGDPRVNQAVAAAVERYGTSVSASRVASGERPFHRALEAALASAQGAEAAVIMPSGHATNVTTIGHLMGERDLILHDELIHDSCLQGIKLSGAARRGFAHDDPHALEQELLALRGHYERVLIVIEGVYSMDGDVADLPGYVALKKRFGCLLMIDEAHSFGTIGATGCGIGEHFGIDGAEVDIWMGTLSKSLASMGGWIAGREELIEYLRYTTPGFVFAAGLAPALGQAALSAFELMRAEPWRVQQLQANAQLFCEALQKHGLDTGPARGQSPVVPVITGNSMVALKLSEELLEAGINAKPIIFPAVAEDAARLRFFLTATHTEEQLTNTAHRIAETLERLRREA